MVKKVVTRSLRNNNDLGNNIVELDLLAEKDRKVGVRDNSNSLRDNSFRNRHANIAVTDIDNGNLNDTPSGTDYPPSLPERGELPAPSANSRDSPIFPGRSRLSTVTRSSNRYAQTDSLLNLLITEGDFSNSVFQHQFNAAMYARRHWHDRHYSS